MPDRPRTPERNNHTPTLHTPPPTPPPHLSLPCDTPQTHPQPAGSPPASTVPAPPTPSRHAPFSEVPPPAAMAGASTPSYGATVAGQDRRHSGRPPPALDRGSESDVPARRRPGVGQTSPPPPATRGRTDDLSTRRLDAHGCATPRTPVVPSRVVVLPARATTCAPRASHPTDSCLLRSAGSLHLLAYS